MGSEERYMNDAIMADWIGWLKDRCGGLRPDRVT
jgi:hypothetical protein